MNYNIIYYLHDDSVLTVIDLETSLQEKRYCQESLDIPVLTFRLLREDSVRSVSRLRPNNKITSEIISTS